MGRASGDFIDMKLYEPGMRFLIDNYISTEEAQKIGSFEDFTLLSFFLALEEKLNNEKDPKSQKSAAETIENNIRKSGGTADHQSGVLLLIILISFPPGRLKMKNGWLFAILKANRKLYFPFNVISLLLQI